MGFPSKKTRFVAMEFETEEQRDLNDWLYDATRNGDVATMIWGMTIAVSRRAPKLA